VHRAERGGAQQHSLRTVGRQLDADARNVLDHSCAELDLALANPKPVSPVCNGCYAGL